MTYLGVLSATFLVLAKIISAAALGFMAGGLISTSFWVNDGTVVRPDRHMVLSKAWRKFFWFAAPPALLFGIPAIVVWFS